ncbi:MAG: BPL-N domain-containing protein [Bacteroidales bacterium]|nr:BPL-N domain-containing protein [Bacteroidales bacterium]MDD4670399.1 BPL-N domain-containing protein [Bacteroidales bacterium]
MTKLPKLSLAMGLIMISSLYLNAQSSAPGFYKDIFMDSGIMLTSRVDLPSARYLNLTYESFISATNKEEDVLTAKDTLIQTSVICGNEMDENGVLLYPDGQPRFRMIYMNGGKATQHGKSLTVVGRERIQQFVKNGGSYVGTCAGAFIACYSTNKEKDRRHEGYLAIWDGLTASTGLSNSYTGMFVEKKSPLLKYYDFGGDMRIDSVRHNGGCYAYDNERFPKGTEILLRYDADTIKLKTSIHKKISAWACKVDDRQGRVISIGSHPEGVESGERLELMSAMVKYAMDGNGSPVVKGNLVNGEPRTMNCSTSDNNPEYTKVGDKQYHHFKVEVPRGVKTLTIKLTPVKGWTNFDLYLFAKHNDFAFNNTADYKDVTLGVAKTMTIDNPAAGTMYISVFCDTTVDSSKTAYGTQYSGRTDVLNGVPYTISVKY